MTPAWAILAGTITLVLMAVFLAIWAWAWLPHHKRKFDELAKLPLDDVEERR